MTNYPGNLTIEQAHELIARALRASQVSDEAARSVATALVAAECDGQNGHGFSRVASYCAQAKSGKVNGFATPQWQGLTSAFARIDAGNGFAFPAIDLAIDGLTEMAATSGIAAVAIHRSHHCGQLGAHVEKLAERGLVALMMANTPKAMAPWGGDSPLFGTNPIAFAAPGVNPAGDALVMDLSLSRVARGKVMAAAQAGETIPPDWALDAQGRPTTDPNAALQGSMVPAGEAKGAALAMMVEVLAATLTGAKYSYEATSFFDAEGEPPGVGQFLMAIHADNVTAGAFSARLQELCTTVEKQPGARLPGSSRFERRARAGEQGVKISDQMLRDLNQLCAVADQ
ncbi:MAG: Ldh family oxidoreductase [Burkholderiaceae bacterium]